MQGTPVRFGAVTALVRCSVTGDGRQGVAASLARKKKARRGKRVAKGDEEAKHAVEERGRESLTPTELLKFRKKHSKQAWR